MNSRKKTLFQNTILLYILTFSNQLLNLITIPYQTRRLQPEFYGKIGYATALMTYFQLFMDFGFILSATREVALSKDNKKELSKIFTAVTLCKIFLGLTLFVTITVIWGIKSNRNDDYVLIILYFFVALTNTLLPDFMYRGLELMKTITYRSVGIKLFFTCMIFLVLKGKEDLYWIPILTIIGNVVSFLIIYLHLKVYLHISFCFTKLSYIRQMFTSSSSFFLSRIAATAYGAINTIILKILYPTGNILGYYTSSDKIIIAARSGFAPICDSMYPYMVKNKDYLLIKKLLFIVTPILVIGCLIVGIWAEDFCWLLFGPEFTEAALILRFLLPIIPIDFISYLIAFPVLAPLGKITQANFSNIIGAILQISLFFLLLILGKLSVITICIATCFTEISVCVYRVIVAFYAIKVLKSSKAERKII